MIFLLICYIFVPLRQNSCKWKKAIVRNMAYIDYNEPYKLQTNICNFTI